MSGANLIGKRVVLRRWRNSDREPFFAMNSDSRVMEFFTERLSREKSDSMLDYIDKMIEERGFGFWAVEVAGVAPLIGFVGLSIPNFVLHFTPCVEIGWRLAFDHWGRGFATEAALLSLQYGFE